MGESRHTPGRLQIIFDGPPGPTAGRFVEAERDGLSLKAGEWSQRPDGFWVLEIDPAAAAPQMLEALREAIRPERPCVLEAGNDGVRYHFGRVDEPPYTAEQCWKCQVRAAIKAATGGVE